MDFYFNDVYILANVNSFNDLIMSSEVENIREYAAAMAEAERDKEIVANEVNQFVHSIKNGLGEEIKHGTPSQPTNKISEFFKRILNTCK